MRAIDRENGVNIGGHNITNIRFADDTVLTANTADDLQILLEKTNSKCRKFGMEINAKKNGHHGTTRRWKSENRDQTKW